MMRIAMIGSGYVGLVSGACFADFGHNVTCVDKDEGKILALKRGESPVFEPGLDDLIKRNTREGRLSFTSNINSCVARANAVFIAVGTPSRRGDGHADLSYVYAAARELATAIDGFTVIITKSTVPVGTGDEVARVIHEARPDADVAVVSNPEFLREGAAIQDFKHPDRIVIGSDDERARYIMAEIYRPLYLNRRPFFIPAAAQPSLSSTRRMLSWPRKSHSSTKLLTWPRKLVLTCKRSPAVSGSTTGLDRNFYIRGRALGGRVFRKIPEPCSRPLTITRYPCALWRL